MDPLNETAARFLAEGKPLEALALVGLGDEPARLALRGTALAQLGDLGTARPLLKRAAEGFRGIDPLAHARSFAAWAEVELAMREWTFDPDELKEVCENLRNLGDRGNALYAGLLLCRRLTLTGHLERARQDLDGLAIEGAPPAVRAIAELIRAELLIREVRAGEARRALDRAFAAAQASSIEALQAEVHHTRSQLDLPVARLVRGGETTELLLHEVEEVLGGVELVVDACRRRVRGPGGEISLGKRVLLFDLLRVLAEAGAAGATRRNLIQWVFESPEPNESDRSRLRVDVGRLRKAILPLSDVVATEEGYALAPRGAEGISLLLPPTDELDQGILALLADGQAWSAAALSESLGASLRTTQRLLASLRDEGRVHGLGGGPARRWLTPSLLRFATTLLLPVQPPPP